VNEPHPHDQRTVDRRDTVPPAEGVGPSSSQPEVAEARSKRRRVRGVLSGAADLIRIVYRDPEHVAERLALHSTQHLAEPARAWAQAALQARPDVSLAEHAEEERIHCAQVARVDGVVSGTPFLFALVPGYLAYLRQETWMGLRTAALYGHDPASLRTAAEMLFLRQVHPNVDAAEAALVRVRDIPMPDKPTARRSLRTWFNSGYTLLVLGGFLSPKGDPGAKVEHSRLKTIAAFAVAAVVLAGSPWADVVTVERLALGSPRAELSS
jgi:hypothetical protein